MKHAQRLTSILRSKIGLLALIPLLIGIIVLWPEGRKENTQPGETPVARADYSQAPRIGMDEAAQEMLDLVNQARRNQGIPPVQLGQNPAAQMHAEQALRNCAISHWDQWGMKPNQRYTLTGGSGTGDENALGRTYCAGPEDGGPHQGITRGDIYDAVKKWLESPGHHRNMLNPKHTIMNVGIAYDQYNTAMIQQFTNNYVQYLERPRIDPEGALSLQGTVQNASLDTGRSIVVQIGYDPPARTLTQGQLSKTHSLCNPTTVGTIRAQPQDEPPHETVMISARCRDPYQNSASTQHPVNAEQAARNWQEAKGTSALIRERQARVHRLTPGTLQISSREFLIRADLTPILDQHGPGIYSITLWGTPAGMDRSTILSEQSIFWKTQPHPDSPYRAEK